MAKVKFSDGTTLNFGEHTPSQAEIEEAYTQVKGGGMGTTSPSSDFDSRLQGVESEIASRPSSVRNLRERGFTGPTGGIATGLMSLLERGEGTIADIGLGLQRGAGLQEILGDINKTAAGQRPAQYGDILRASGSPGISSRPVSSAMGMFATPGGAELGALGIRGAMKAPQVIGSGLRGIGRGIVRTGQVLTGNQAGETQAMSSLTKDVGKFIRSYRYGGENQAAGMKALKSASTDAWAPMKKVIQAIKEPISLDDLSKVAETKFGHDPARLENVKELISMASKQPESPTLFDYAGRQLEKVKNVYTPQELDDLASDFGTSMRKMAKTGKGARDSVDQLLADARSIIADTLEAKAPDDMKGMVQLAKSKWAKYATVRDQFNQVIHPFRGQEDVIGSGGNTLRQASRVGKNPGAMDDAETIAMNIKEMFGIDVVGPLKPSVKALRRQQTIGKVGPAVGIATGGAGGILGLLNVLNRKND